MRIFLILLLLLYYGTTIAQHSSALVARSYTIGALSNPNKEGEILNEKKNGETEISANDKIEIEKDYRNIQEFINIENRILKGKFYANDQSENNVKEPKNTVNQKVEAKVSVKKEECSCRKPEKFGRGLKTIWQ